MLRAGDPLPGEWDIAVLGPHFAARLVACDLGDTGPDAERRFEFVLSHDRELTIAVVHSLMSRIWPEPRAVDVPELPGPAVVQLPRQSGPVDEPAQVLEQLSDGLLRRAVSAATTGITIVDVRLPDQPLVWVNPAFEALSGHRAQDVLGRNCRLLQGPATDPGTVAEIGAAVAAGRGVQAKLRNYRADGTAWWNDLTLCPVHDADGQLTHYVGVQHDVTARVEAEQNVLHLAYHDPLTDLPNRARLDQALSAALDRGARARTATGMVYIDLDDFKAVNDRYGHSVGDQLLRAVSARLRAGVRADDLLARQGGDEFLLLLADLPPAEARRVAERAAEEVLQALQEPFDVAGIEVRAAASVGVAVQDGPGAQPDDLLRWADRAMYEVKSAGGRRWVTA